MWTANRNSTSVQPQRTPSVHSIASVTSAGRPQSIAMNSPNQLTAAALDNHAAKTGRIQPLRVESMKGAVPALGQVQNRPDWNAPTDDDATSRSSTLDGEEEYMDHHKKHAASRPAPVALIREEPRSPLPAPHVPGPLESQLAALMSKLIYLEQANPTISIQPEEYKEMKNRIKTLEEEKKQWTKRHEAIWALRDEDVENNIKIRVSNSQHSVGLEELANNSPQGYLAKARRELEETKKLREEDLSNVLIVRAKLAEKTRELERLQGPTGRTSPVRGRPGSFERRDTADLFAMAKSAALEQRVLELEKRNSDLVSQVDTLKGGANIDDLNRLTAHQVRSECTTADET